MKIQLYSSKSSLKVENTSKYPTGDQPVRFIPNALGGTHTFTLDRHEDKQLSSNNILRKFPLNQTLAQQSEVTRNIGNVGVLH